MDKIHSMLSGNDVGEHLDDEKTKKRSSTFDILCLGNGKGATTLLTGEPSSSFVIFRDQKPLLLVDLGFGVVQSYRKYVNKEVCFENVYITHNHGDHAAELPVILAVVCGKRRPPTLFAAPEVMHRLLTQRLAEVTSANELEQLVNIKTCEPGNSRTKISDDGRYHISVLPSQHPETCYGFVLYDNGEPVLGYTGDSGFSQSLYDQLLCAPNIVVDARTTSTFEHAGFSDVIDYFKDKKAGRATSVHHWLRRESEYPEEGINGMTQLRTGERHSPLPSSGSSMPSSCNYSRTSVTAEYLLPETIQAV